MHPKLLGVPEISRHLARFWLTASGAVHWFIILRSTSHARVSTLVNQINWWRMFMNYPVREEELVRKMWHNTENHNIIICLLPL